MKRKRNQKEETSKHPAGNMSTATSPSIDNGPSSTNEEHSAGPTEAAVLSKVGQLLLTICKLLTNTCLELTLLVTRENKKEEHECTWQAICADGRPSIELFQARLSKRLGFNTNTEKLYWCKPRGDKRSEIIDEDNLLVAKTHVLREPLYSLGFVIGVEPTRRGKGKVFRLRQRS